MLMLVVDVVGVVMKDGLLMRAAGVCFVTDVDPRLSATEGLRKAVVERAHASTRRLEKRSVNLVMVELLLNQEY
jgi:hypothetical protein